MDKSIDTLVKNVAKAVGVFVLYGFNISLLFGFWFAGHCNKLTSSGNTACDAAPPKLRFFIAAIFFTALLVVVIRTIYQSMKEDIGKMTKQQNILSERRLKVMLILSVAYALLVPIVAML